MPARWAKPCVFLEIIITLQLFLQLFINTNYDKLSHARGESSTHHSRALTHFLFEFKLCSSGETISFPSSELVGVVLRFIIPRKMPAFMATSSSTTLMLRCDFVGTVRTGVGSWREEGRDDCGERADEGWGIVLAA